MRSRKCLKEVRIKIFVNLRKEQKKNGNKQFVKKNLFQSIFVHFIFLNKTKEEVVRSQ